MAWNKGKKLPAEYRKKISETMKRKGIKPKKPFRFTGKKRPPYSKEWLDNMSKAHKGNKHSEKTKKKMSETHRKKWDKIGRKETKRYIHSCNTAEYKKWRLAVFTRDNFTCVNCKKVGGYLEAHHIKSWAKYPKLRLNINNGITLCRDCHKLTDNYKGKGREL